MLVTDYEDQKKVSFTDQIQSGAKHTKSVGATRQEED